ncbi:hypothetical protein ACOTF3_04350 [Achromobacter xylosoxidans]
MKLIKASIHETKTAFGTKVAYARLIYRLPRGILAQSLLSSRLDPETRKLAGTGYPSSAS